MSSAIAGPPAVFPAPQDLPVHRRQCAEDRLQGREAVAAVHLGARQDRAEPYHRGVHQKAARAAHAIKRSRFLGLLPYVIR